MSNDPLGSSPPQDAPTTLSGALVETTLREARLTALYPGHLELVGTGLRLRIDHSGVSSQELAALRLALPLPPAATKEAGLQALLGRWAAHSSQLHVHDTVQSGERYRRVLYLSDAHGHRITLDNHGPCTWQ